MALVPEAVSKLKTTGFDIGVERGAGVAASFPDDAYAEAGAELVEEVWDAAGIVKRPARSNPEKAVPRKERKARAEAAAKA